MDCGSRHEARLLEAPVDIFHAINLVSSRNRYCLEYSRNHLVNDEQWLINLIVLFLSTKLRLVFAISQVNSYYV